VLSSARTVGTSLATASVRPHTNDRCGHRYLVDTASLRALRTSRSRGEMGACHPANTQAHAGSPCLPRQLPAVRRLAIQESQLPTTQDDCQHEPDCLPNDEHTSTRPQTQPSPLLLPVQIPPFRQGQNNNTPQKPLLQGQLNFTRLYLPHTHTHIQHHLFPSPLPFHLDSPTHHHHSQ
jgi:hypothetical protein